MPFNDYYSPYLHTTTGTNSATTTISTHQQRSRLSRRQSAPLVETWEEDRDRDRISNWMNYRMDERNTYSTREYDGESMDKRQKLALALKRAIKQDNPTPLYGVNVRNMRLGSFFNRIADFSWGEYVCQCTHCFKLQDTEADGAGERPNDDGWICAGCAAGNYIRSEIMGGYLIPRREVVEVRSRNRSGWATADWARNRSNAIYHEGLQCYVTREYWDELSIQIETPAQHDARLARERDRMIQEAHRRGAAYPTPPSPFHHENPVGIGGYHSSKPYMELLPSEYARRKLPLFLGIELEVECTTIGKTAESAARAVKRLLNGPNAELHYCLTERDGSLSNGFEIVTSYTGLDTHEKVLSKLASKEFKEIRDIYRLRSHDTGTCGLHINIDRGGITNMHRAKLVSFANARANHRLMQSMCRRGATSHAKWKPDEYNKLSQITLQQTVARDRYEIINFNCNAKVIEFRGPRGTLRYESIMAAMEFIRALWLFTRDAGQNQLNAIDFCNYVFHDAAADEVKYLRQYMVERNIYKLPSAPAKVASVHSEPRRMNLQDAYADALAMGFIATSIDL